jgi:hypothetical protein
METNTRALTGALFLFPAKGGEMTFIEELVSLVVRIQNVRARIECAEEADMAICDREELTHLLRRLEKLKGGRGKVECGIIRIRATVTREIKEGMLTKVYA